MLHGLTLIFSDGINCTDVAVGDSSFDRSANINLTFQIIPRRVVRQSFDQPASLFLDGWL